MIALGAVPALILGIGLFGMPESPRWLVGRGRVDDARRVLRQLRPTAEADAELESIRATVSLRSLGLRGLFQPALRPALVIGVGLALFGQFTGVTTVVYFAPTTFTAAGFETGAALVGTFGIGILLLLATILGVFLVDRVGRRPLLLVGLPGMAISLAVIGAMYLLPDLSGAPALTIVLMTATYIMFFAVSLGVVAWVVPPEIFPLAARGAANGMCTMVLWAGNFTVTLTFLPMVEAFGAAVTFGILAAITVIAFVFVVALVPETKGKSLEQLERDLVMDR
ncbi:MFS transporter [Pseudonocardia sp.]|uniref:MFS transporter n=1 Tax=Pseudonocardia sp. TaxID=60912 RepID=UPI003D0EA3F6